MDKITGFIPASAMIKVVSGAAIKADILEVFDQTFIITSALQILTALVALTGILNSVMALILERSRELGILRACGAEKRQLGTLLLIECGFSGLISGLLALPLGICLAWILIDMINRRAFGWTYDMAFSPVLLVQAVLLSTLAAVAAGIVPAIRAGKIDIGKALRME
jgi:putative ABC transport system permease protein